MKRAKELGKEDMIPADWNEPEAPEAEADAPAEKEEDVELINALAEFQNMLDGEDLDYPEGAAAYETRSLRASDQSGK